MVARYGTADLRLAETESRIDDCDIPFTGGRIGGEQDPRRVRIGHLLNDDGKCNLVVWDVVSSPIGDGSVSEEARHARADCLSDFLFALNIEEGFVLACERSTREIFGGRTRSSGVGLIYSAVSDCVLDCCSYFGWKRQRLDGVSERPSSLCNRLRVLWVERFERSGSIRNV
nr:hypothetical protein [Natrinema gelatinilyticum]